MRNLLDKTPKERLHKYLHDYVDVPRTKYKKDIERMCDTLGINYNKHIENSRKLLLRKHK